MLDTGNSGIGPTGGLKFESRLYPSTSDKRNPLAICIGSGSQRRLLQLQTVREIHACFWDTLVEAPRDSGKTTLLSQPGKHFLEISDSIPQFMVFVMQLAVLAT
jgi:hypothetical protein